MSIGISIVEDDEQTREILMGWIKRSRGFHVVSSYGSAEKALVRLPSDKPEVALMDINLPAMSGIECVRQLKLIMPDTQFLMLTVYEDSDHLFDALAGGASGYLLKRTSREELLEALKEIHSGGSPMSSNIARKLVQSFRRAPGGPGLSGGMEDLTPREREVLQLLASGDLYKEIAETLGISITTVNAHIRRIYEKLHVRSRGQAVAKFAHINETSGHRRPLTVPR
ncbi:MAG: response regulator transcription factor [Verrucomicrobiota bacterium]|jgi:DNA-binding NarL/FixJ family response regulator